MDLAFLPEGMGCVFIYFALLQKHCLSGYLIGSSVRSPTPNFSTTKLQSYIDSNTHLVRYALAIFIRGLSTSQIEECVGAPPDGVLVNGDSGNDIELFAVPGARGTMVANAHPELRAWVQAHASPNIFQVFTLFFGSLYTLLHNARRVPCGASSACHFVYSDAQYSE